MRLRKLKALANASLESAVPAHRGIFARLWPWLVALVILAFLFSRIPRQALYSALKTGPWISLGVYTLLQAILILGADAYATSKSLVIIGLRQRYSLIFLARGATYILGILNYALGQGAFGLYLQRSGVATLRAAGTMLFLMIVNLGVLLFVASFGLVIGANPGSLQLDLSFLGYGLLVAVMVYLIILWLRPRFLRSYQLLAPLWEAGLWGHLQAACLRLPHVLLLVVTYWGALRLCSISVPLAQGMSMLPLVLLAGALPITPAGLGTSQAALVLLFSQYAPLPTPEARAAAVLAFGLIYYFLGIIVQFLLGLCCWQRLRNNN